MPKKTFDNPEAEQNKSITVSALISYLEREREKVGHDCDVRICVPYADGLGVQFLPIKDVHRAGGAIDILTMPFDND